MRLLAALLALLLSSLIAAGCGDDDADEGAPNDPFFGVVSVEAPNSGDFARMAQGGVGTYRLLIAWSTVEAKKGTYDWGNYDSQFAELARAGIEPLATVVGTPAGYAPRITDPPTRDQETFDAWADFLKAATERYGPGGDFWEAFNASDPDATPQPPGIWEIWNEPNTSLFWTPAPDPDAYATLLRRSARVIQGVDPDAQIMTGGIFATPQSEGAIVSYDFLENLFSQRGMTEIIDSVGVHPYSPDVSGVVGQLDGTREVIEAAGDDATTWITELGWSSSPVGPSDQAKTPEQQTALLRKTYTKLRDRRDEWGLEGVVWFSWTDATGPVGECSWCQYAGLVDTDRDTKPAWAAYADLAGGTP